MAFDITKQRLTYQIEPLTGEKNYELWSIRMEALLAREGLAQYIKVQDFGYTAVVENGPLIEPDQSAIKSVSLIKLNCFDGPLLQVRHISKPYEVWKALENLYSPKGFSSEFLLCKELFDTTLEKSNNKMELYLNQIKRLYDQLTAKNVIIPEKVIFAWVLNNLSSNYETLITTITQSIRVNGADSFKLEELFSNLIDESKRLKSKDSDAIALFTKTKKAKEYKPYNQNKVQKHSKNKSELKCEHCHKKGHKIDKCWVKNPHLHPKKKEKEDINEEIAMTTCHYNTSTEKELDFDVASFNEESFTYSSVSMPLSDTHCRQITAINKDVYSTLLNKTSWILDSGATTHICCEKSLFKEIKTTDIKISWGKLGRIKASGIGDVPIVFTDTNIKAVLKNCLFVPEFDINLISISLILQKGFKVLFNNTCQIMSSNDTLVSSAKCNQGLYNFPIIGNLSYIFSTISCKEKENATTLWHKRMGHIGKKALKELKNPSNNNHIKELTDFICEECILAKATKHINHSVSDNVYTKYLQLVQSDLFGPVQVYSFSKKHYFITFLDAYTKWLEIDLLSHKNHAFKAFKDYLNREERISDKELKVLRTDNGTEYNEISKYCTEKGIIHQKTAPYAHEQAGAAERINLTLLNKVRSMLFTAKLAKQFWAEALISAVYLYNRTPHSALDYKSPYEVRYNKKPDINNVKIWGSIAYNQIEKAKKLDIRAKPNILIGYGNNQYKLMDLNTKRVFWSRDVVILEGVFLYNWETNTQNKPQTEVFIDLNQEELDTVNTDKLIRHTSFRGANTDNNKDIINQQHHECDIPLSNNEDNTSNDELAINEPNSLQKYDIRSHTNTNYDNNSLDDLSDDELAFSTIQDSNIASDPITYKQAINSYNANKWQKAMEKEINDLKSQNTWSIVNLPKDKNIIKGRWVYKTKLNKDGTIDKYKARWVAKGFQQIYGIDFTETFSNTVKPMVFRALFALAAYLNLEIQQWDIKSAFPNAKLDEEIYIMQPTGFEDNTNRVCLLNKALYGLKQSARQFYIFLASMLKEFNYAPIIADQSVFYNNKNNVIITAHIDDLLIFAEKKEDIELLKNQLKSKVEISDLGDISYYLGMQITRDRVNNQLFLSQQKYIKELLNRFNIKGEKPIYSPSVQGVRLEKNLDQADQSTIKAYQQQIGSLMYLMTATRPDLAFSVSNCARYMSNPNEEHFKALNRIWQYVRTTQNKGLLYKSSNKPKLIGYVDSDWGGDYTTKKSTTGYIFLFGSAPISWSSRLQKSVALSSCEAEYMALKEATKELIWLKAIFNQIKLLNSYSADILHCDNISAIDLSKNPEYHARTKHIDIQYHFIRDYIDKKVFNLLYINTKDQLADALTKTLDINSFRSFTYKINLVELEEAANKKVRTK